MVEEEKNEVRDTWCTDARCVELSNVQRIVVHGWSNPIKILKWDHVLKNPRLSMSFLQKRAGVSEADLYFLQPEVKEWVKSGRVELSDVPRMTMWPLHPVEHLQADLSDIMCQQYSLETFQKCGITYSYLYQRLYLNESHMPVFNLTLKEWALLGLTVRDLNNFSAAGLRTLFGMDRCDVIRYLQDGFWALPTQN